MTAQILAALCADEIDRLGERLAGRPTRTDFFDLGACAEVLALCPHVRATRPHRDQLVRAAFDWLRAGRLDDALFARDEHLYHVALFCELARQHPDWRPPDAGRVADLLGAGLAGRNELPTVTIQAAAACLSACGVLLERPAVDWGELELVIDKRVLRTRSDESDLSVLVMVAQIAARSDVPRSRLPSLFPQTLLAQAIRRGELNWVAILALLCRSFYGMPAWLDAGASQVLAAHVARSPGLLPPPASSWLTNEYVRRAEHGLRLRSSLAAVALLHA